MSVLGARGGNRVWNDFMSSDRCGGVVGDGGGKDARTSCVDNMLIIFSGADLVTH